MAEKNRLLKAKSAYGGADHQAMKLPQFGADQRPGAEYKADYHEME